MADAMMCKTSGSTNLHRYGAHIMRICQVSAHLWHAPSNWHNRRAQRSAAAHNILYTRVCSATLCACMVVLPPLCCTIVLHLVTD